MKKFFFPFILIMVAVATTVIYRSTQGSSISYHLGHRVFERGQYQTAIPLFKKAIELDVSNIQAIKELAYSYQRSGSFEEAVPLLEKAIKADQNDDVLKEALADIYFWQGHYSAAIDIYSKLMVRVPAIRLKYKLIDVHIANGEHKSAKELAVKIVNADPEDLRARFLLAKALTYSGEQAVAIGLLEELLRLVRNNSRE